MKVLLVHTTVVTFHNNLDLSSLRPDPPPPLPHALHSPPILLKLPLQCTLSLLPALPILEAIEVIGGPMIPLPLIQLCFLLLCVFDPRRPDTSASRNRHEAIFVRNRAGCFAEAIPGCF